MPIQPYLFFDGRCEEALDFYKRALGAEVTMLMRFKDSPEPPSADCVQPGNLDKVMHASVKIGDSIWRVEGPELPKGTRVRVLGVDGTLLKVTAA